MAPTLTGLNWFFDHAETISDRTIGRVSALGGGIAVLSADFFSGAEEEIKSLTSGLTLVDGRPVYAAEEFSELDPPLTEVMPDWSPVRHFSGYGAPCFDSAPASTHIHTPACGCLPRSAQIQSGLSQLGGSDCEYFAF